MEQSPQFQLTTNGQFRTTVPADDVSENKCLATELSNDVVAYESVVRFQRILPVLVTAIGALSSLSNGISSILALELAVQPRSKTITSYALPILAAFFNSMMSFILFCYSKTIPNSQKLGSKVDDFISKRSIKKISAPSISTISEAITTKNLTKVSPYFLFATLTMGDVFCTALVVYKTTISLATLAHKKKNAMIFKTAINPIAMTMAVLTGSSLTLFESSFAITAGNHFAKQIKAHHCFKKKEAIDHSLAQDPSDAIEITELNLSADSKKGVFQKGFPILTIAIRTLACICTGINCLLAIASDQQTKNHATPIITAFFNATMAFTLFAYSDTIPYAKKLGSKADHYFFSKPKINLQPNRDELIIARNTSCGCAEISAYLLFFGLVIGDVSFTAIADYQTIISLGDLESQKGDALIGKNVIAPMALIMTIITTMNLLFFEASFAMTGAQHLANLLSTVYKKGRKKDSWQPLAQNDSYSDIDAIPQEGLALGSLSI